MLRKHYETIIVFCCFLALFVNQGMTSSSFNIYQTYIVQIPGVGDTGGSFILTLRTLVSLITMVFVGKYYRKLSLRAGLFIATCLTAIGFLLYMLVGMNYSKALPLFCAGAVVTGIGYGFGGMVAVTMLIGTWFRDHVGSVAGIAGAGSGVASIVIPMIAVGIIENLGLSWAFFSEAACALVIAVILVILVRNKPQDLGHEPFVSKRRSGRRSNNKLCIATGDMPKVELRMMEVACAMVGAIAVVSIGYFSILMTSSGISNIAAAALTSICGIVLTIAKFVSGWVFDLIGTKKASTILFAILTVGLLSGFFIGVGGEWAAFFASIFIGMGCSIATTGMTIWGIELSTIPSRMRVVKNLSVSYAFGAFLFNMMPGTLKTYIGNYELSYLILAILSVVSAILIMIVYSKNEKRCREQRRSKEAVENAGTAQIEEAAENAED